MRFSRDIPTTVRQNLPSLLQQACEKWDIEHGAIRHHPGGAKVLFVLEHFLDTTPPSGDYRVMLALGPGFSAKQFLFRR